MQAYIIHQEEKELSNTFVFLHEEKCDTIRVKRSLTRLFKEKERERVSLMRGRENREGDERSQSLSLLSFEVQ